MLIIRACLLWAVISANIVGGAFLFRRFFPRESPWLGFIVPEIILVVLGNFIEHAVALPALSWLPLFSTLGSFWLLMGSKNHWRVMRLPTLIFLGVFAFTLTLRMLRPSISDTRDGIADLALISDFCFGQTLPVESTWVPPIKLLYYYFLPHYGASLFIRFLGLDMGTGYNLCAALLSAYIYFLTGAVAWHLSRGKLWITVLAVLVTGCAATGAIGFFLLTGKDFDPEDVVNVYVRMEDPDVHFWLWKYLTPIPDVFARHELLVPGYWGWMGAFHSSAVGQLLICIAVFSLVELLRRKRTNWPWICLVFSSFLMLTSCSWGVPLTGLLLLAGLFACWRMKIVPENGRVVLMTIAFLVLCLEPMLSYFLMWSSPSFDWATGLHTQVAEFLVQWWPIYLPWLALLFIWKKLPPVTRILLVLTPLFFGLVETFNIGQRYDMTGKLWGMIFGAAWMTFFPVIAAQRAWFFRGLLALLLLSNAFSLYYWCDYYWRAAPPNDVAHLDGLGPLRWDGKKAHLLETISHLHHQTIISSKSGWAGTESPLLAEFTQNRVYVTWSVICDDGFYSQGLGEGYRREVPVNNLYDGKIENPLIFLRQRDIAALVIYPDDHITDEVVQKLKQNLEPYYSYEDYREGNPPGPPNAGIFLYHPEMSSLVGRPPGNTVPDSAAPAR